MADHDHDPALVEKAAQALAEYNTTAWHDPEWDDLQPSSRDEYEASAFAALDAVAADLTRQAVEQALKPIEVVVRGRHPMPYCAADGRIVVDLLARLRAAVEQARGGATT